MNLYQLFSKFKPVQLAIIPILFLFSCEYVPDKVFNNPTHPDPGSPDVQVVELSLSDDTVYLYTDKSFTFQFSSSNQEIRTVVYMVDNSIKGTVTSADGQFQIQQNDFYDGKYDLAIKVYTYSGTGSIADQLGMEGYLFEKHWVLIVDRTATSRTNYTADNGNLRLNWAEYKGSDLKEYIIYRKDARDSLQEIGRSATNHYIDPCYVGEGGEYKVHAVLKSGQDLFWGDWQLGVELPKLDYSGNHSNQYFVFWSRSRFYNGISKIDLLKADNDLNYQIVHTSTSAADTIYHLNNILFGEIFNYRITLTPKKYPFQFVPSYQEIYTTDCSGRGGYHFSENISTNTPVFAVENNQVLFNDEAQGLVRFDLGTLKNQETYIYNSTLCETRHFFDLGVSPMGKYYSAHICDFEHLITARTAALSISQVKDMSAITGTFSRMIPVSDNAIGLVSSSKDGGGILLYNLNDQSVMAEYKVNPTVSSGLRISSNADYFLVADMDLKLIHYANQQFTVLESLPYSLDNFIEFSRTNPDQFAFWDQSVFKIERCSDQGTVYSFPLTDEKVLSVDYLNKQILTAAGLHLYVRSMTDGALLHDIQIQSDDMYTYYSCCLADHKILSSVGILYFLN